MASGGRELEADGGGEGTARRNGVQSEPRPTGGGAHHGVRQSPVLCAYRRGLHDEAADGRHAADAVRLRPRLYSATEEQHQLQAASPMGRSDCQRKYSQLLQEKLETGVKPNV